MCAVHLRAAVAICVRGARFLPAGKKWRSRVANNAWHQRRWSCRPTSDRSAAPEEPIARAGSRRLGAPEPGARGGGRRAPRAAAKAARFEVEPPPRRPPPSPRRRPRRPRPAERRRRPARGPRQARRLPRRKPVHHLGLQVRAARGRREAAPPRLAGTRGSARGRGVAACSPTPPRRRARAPRDSELFAAIREEIERADPPPARGAGRGGAERGPDRRPRRAPRTRPAARSTRPFTTPAASSAPRSPPAGSIRRRTETEERS